MSDEKRICEWYEIGHIQHIDELVSEFDKEHSGVTIEPGYMDNTFTAIHLADWKTEFTDWMIKIISDLTTILDEVDLLPDDEFELYTELGDTYTGFVEEEE